MGDAPEDHPILDAIHEYLGKRELWLPPAFRSNPTRESESIEFTDPTDGRKYEIVVRPIEGDDEGECP